MTETTEKQNKKFRSPLARAIQVILDLTEDTDYVCEMMHETFEGSEWCRENCGENISPNHKCCREWLCRHWNN